MAYGLCRLRAVKMADLGAIDMHDSRDYARHGAIVPDNIDSTRSSLNCGWGQKDYWKYKGIGGNLSGYIAHQIDTKKIKGIRKDSRVGIEFVFACSDKRMLEQMQPVEKGIVHPFLRGVYEFCNKEFKGCVFSYLHQDESNPHVHVFCFPTEEKKIKRKNRYGEKIVKETRIVVRDIVNGADKLSAIQSKYFNWLTQFQNQYAKEHPEYTPVELYRGTQAEKNLREYTNATNHRIGLIRAAIASCKREMDAKALEMEIERITNETATELNRLQQEVEKKRTGALPPEWQAQGMEQDRPKPSYRRRR